MCCFHSSVFLSVRVKSAETLPHCSLRPASSVSIPNRMSRSLMLLALVASVLLVAVAVDAKSAQAGASIKSLTCKAPWLFEAGVAADGGVWNEKSVASPDSWVLVRGRTHAEHSGDREAQACSSGRGTVVTSLLVFSSHIPIVSLLLVVCCSRVVRALCVSLLLLLLLFLLSVSSLSVCVVSAVCCVLWLLVQAMWRVVVERSSRDRVGSDDL